MYNARVGPSAAANGGEGRVTGITFDGTVTMLDDEGVDAVGISSPVPGATLADDDTDTAAAPTGDDGINDDDDSDTGSL